MKNPVVALLLVLCFLSMISSVQSGEIDRVPIIYSTDLYHPPQDPDDHYDLAFLFALEEFDVKLVLFDNATARKNPGDHGIGALQQVAAIFKRPIPPWAIGLSQPLQSHDDQGTDQPAEYRKGVELLLETLRQSEQKVVLFLVGSCRDFAAAYNREPELLKNKVKAVYVNAGNGPDGKQNEWNVTLDPIAYERLMMSDLPIFWCPCFEGRFPNTTPEEIETRKQFATHFIIPNQAEFLQNASPELKNYFFYALNHRTEEPLAFLKTEPQPLPTSGRHMWCSGPFLHAAGREIYRSNTGKPWLACSPEQAKSLGLPDKPIDVFRFEPIQLEQAVPYGGSAQVAENDTCRFMGAKQDRVGQLRLEQDGIKDNHVRMSGLAAGEKVTEIVITAPNAARWQSTPSERWWRVVAERNGDILDCFFSPYTSGVHTISVSFADGTTRDFSCDIPEPWAYFRSTFAADAPIRVFRCLDKDFNAILCSVVSDILEKAKP